tara:strand:+ start:202 stop:375 length:174 start_codon:yes stop_codon:yes gene_type:complete
MSKPYEETIGHLEALKVMIEHLDHESEIKEDFKGMHIGVLTEVIKLINDLIAKIEKI